MKKRIFFLSIGLSYFFIFSGCHELHHAARDVGRPIGGIARTPQALTEGIADGYVGDSNTSNPYAR